MSNVFLSSQGGDNLQLDDGTYSAYLAGLRVKTLQPLQTVKTNANGQFITEPDVDLSEVMMLDEQKDQLMVGKISTTASNFNDDQNLVPKKYVDDTISAINYNNYVNKTTSSRQIIKGSFDVDKLIDNDPSEALIRVRGEKSRINLSRKAGVGNSAYLNIGDDLWNRWRIGIEDDNDFKLIWADSSLNDSTVMSVDYGTKEMTLTNPLTATVPSKDESVANKKYVDDTVSGIDYSDYLSKTDTAEQEVKSQVLSDQTQFTKNGQLVTKKYVDDTVSGIDYSDFVSKTDTAEQGVKSQILSDQTQFTKNGQLVTKKYVDDTVSGIDYSDFVSKSTAAGQTLNSDLNIDKVNEDTNPQFRGDDVNLTLYKNTGRGGKTATLSFQDYLRIFFSVGLNGDNNFSVKNTYDAQNPSTPLVINSSTNVCTMDRPRTSKVATDNDDIPNKKYVDGAVSAIDYSDYVNKTTSSRQVVKGNFDVDKLIDNDPSEALFRVRGEKSGINLSRKDGVGNSAYLNIGDDLWNRWRIGIEDDNDFKLIWADSSLNDSTVMSIDYGTKEMTLMRPLTTTAPTKFSSVANKKYVDDSIMHIDYSNFLKLDETKEQTMDGSLAIVSNTNDATLTLDRKTASDNAEITFNTGGVRQASAELDNDGSLVFRNRSGNVAMKVGYGLGVDIEEVHLTGVSTIEREAQTDNDIIGGKFLENNTVKSILIGINPTTDQDIRTLDDGGEYILRWNASQKQPYIHSTNVNEGRNVVYHVSRYQQGSGTNKKSTQNNIGYGTPTWFDGTLNNNANGNYNLAQIGDHMYVRAIGQPGDYTLPYHEFEFTLITSTYLAVKIVRPHDYTGRV